MVACPLASEQEEAAAEETRFEAERIERGGQVAEHAELERLEKEWIERDWLAAEC